MVTMNDVARHAGVAVSTVSYALNGTRPISEETRRRIEASMDELGYRPHAVARALASKRSRIIALLLPAVRRGLGHTEFDFVAGAVEAAGEHGYHLVVWSSEFSEGAELEQLVGQGLVDGVILMEVRLDDDRVRVLTEHGRPFALIGRTEDTSDLSFVDIDFAQTTRDALAYLRGLGHERIAFVNHARAEFDGGYGPAVRALAGFGAAAADQGIEAITRFCDDSPAGGREVAAELLDAHPDLTALVVMNDRAVPGFLQVLAERGRRVPDDVSIVSIVSSVVTAEMTVPALTVLAPRSHELGRRGVELVLRSIEPGDAELTQDLLPCDLVVGSSTGPRPERRPQRV
ncbi:MAG: LacI family DNA-binding transcriptional regulator [Actinomycetota bacterium]|nr:LacI family DNA-binding transcriptional regulator [Actinomycetota bacterium]